MKTTYSKIVLIAALMTLPACKFFDDLGVTESSTGTPTSTPADFSVVPGTGSTTPPPAETPPTPPPENGFNDIVEEALILYNAQPRTSATAVDAEFITFNRFEMKLGYTQDCTDGVWEPWEPTRTIQLDRFNQPITISVQYKDWDGRRTACFKQSFIQDMKGPDIVFQRYPTTNLEEGATTSLGLQVTDALSAIKSVTCSLNGFQRPCVPGTSDINITAMPEGSYTFTVTASDELDNVSSKTIIWNVVATTRHLSQDIRLNDFRKVDILFVIDNSGSMEYEQQNMAQRTSNFLSVLRGLDWQIGITTTDPRNIALGDGRMIPITGATGTYLLNSSMDEATAQQRLSATLQRPETGSGEEQGIRAVYRSIERYISGADAANRSFYRDGSQLAVVLISDEDESANTAANDPQNLMNLVHSTFGGQKMFSFHSIITRPGDTACKSTYGYTYGERYKMITDLTGGILGNVCEMDYSVQVQGIAQGIRDLLKTLTLACAPLQDRAITVTLDGAPVATPFHVEGQNLKFDQELLPGNYNVSYSCVK
jgi:hypothetical protein